MFDHTNKLREVTIHSALNKPNLLFGADRELILVVGLISAVLIFLGMTVPTFVIGVIIWLVFSYALRKIANADPLMRKIYLRQLKYRKFYFSHSTPFFKEN
jgi:type IV secretion system protein TrbD